MDLRTCMGVMSRRVGRGREARAIISVLGRSKDPRIIVPEIETLTRSILVRSVEEYNDFWSGERKLERQRSPISA